jgi:micrococcal nuclease
MPFGARLPSAGAILILIAGVVLLFLTEQEDAGDSAGGKGGQGAERVSATVTRVVDGDTAEMELEGQSDEEDVRFIGVDTPESVAPDQPVECFGPQASDFTADLIEGERVLLKFGAERRDQYGRLLAYVYVEETFVNAELVRRGYARTLEIAPNVDFADRFASLQQAAANSGRGLWGAC